MGGSDHRKRVVARDVSSRGHRKRIEASHVRTWLLKGSCRSHPNAIRSKENRGSSSDGGRRNAIVVVIRRDGRKVGRFVPPET